MFVAGVHGIWNYRYYTKHAEDAAGELGRKWLESVAGGLGGLDPAVPPPAELPVAYYADCLARGVPMGADSPETLEPDAQRIFSGWVGHLAGADASTAQAAWSRHLVKRQAEWLTREHGSAATLLIALLSRELATYFSPQHADRRARCWSRLEAVLERHRPRVLIAHSLGSVVAYETLHRRPDLRVQRLITLGSPLSVPHVVFHRLLPSPGARGTKPPGVGDWINIADVGDPVSHPAERFTEFFDGVSHDHQISIHRFDPHSAVHYLRTPALASALAPYLG
ncbi:hypothetical protein GCM10027589_50120 [Actinocorallia lasiicapitis]